MQDGGGHNTWVAGLTVWPLACLSFSLQLWCQRRHLQRLWCHYRSMSVQRKRDRTNLWPLPGETHTWSFPSELMSFLRRCHVTFTHLYCFFFLRWGSLGCKVGKAARPVVVANQDLSLSLVTSKGDVSVWRVWLEISVTAALMVIMVSMEMAAQVGQ